MHGDVLERNPKLVESDPTFPFIVVSPQVPFDPAFMPDAFPALLDDVVRELPVDEDRIYLTGLSMGGYGTWRMALAQPERFAAIAPICGGGSLIDVILGGRDHPGRFNSLAVWAFHGAKDDVVPRDESERMVAAMKHLGANDVKLTVSLGPSTARYAASALSVTRMSMDCALSNHASTSPWAFVVSGFETAPPPESAS